MSPLAAKTHAINQQTESLRSAQTVREIRAELEREFPAMYNDKCVECQEAERAVMFEGRWLCEPCEKAIRQERCEWCGGRGEHSPKCMDSERNAAAFDRGYAEARV
jgi:hypothetical protein